MGRTSPEGLVKQKISLKEGLIVISLLLLTVYLFDHFSNETVTSATASGGITGASHVDVSSGSTDLDKFQIKIHNFLEAYVGSGKSQQDKQRLITDTEKALEELYK